MRVLGRPERNLRNIPSNINRVARKYVRAIEPRHFLRVFFTYPFAGKSFYMRDYGPTLLQMLV